MQFRTSRFLLLLVMAAFMVAFGLGCSGILAEPAVPQPTSAFYVLDEAEVLSPQVENQIVSVSRELAAKTKAQVVVVTLKDTRGRTLEELGLEILRSWGVGDKELNNGVVMLVIPDERKSRIEVGYGLEGALPDGKTGRIQDDYMLPYFRQGDYNQGIINGFMVIVQETANEYQVALSTSQQPARPAQPSQPAGEKLSTWQVILIIVGLVLLFILDRHFFNGLLFGMLLSMLFRGGGGGFGGGGSSGGGGGFGGGGGSSRGW